MKTKFFFLTLFFLASCLGVKFILKNRGYILPFFYKNKVVMLTVLLHVILASMANELIYHYQDSFLIFSIILLISYIIYILRTYRENYIPFELIILYMSGVLVQAILTSCFGAFEYGYLGGLGFGSGMALFLYGIILMVSCMTMLMINIVKWMIQKG